MPGVERDRCLVIEELHATPTGGKRGVRACPQYTKWGIGKKE